MYHKLFSILIVLPYLLDRQIGLLKISLWTDQHRWVLQYLHVHDFISGLLKQWNLMEWCAIIVLSIYQYFSQTSIKLLQSQLPLKSNLYNCIYKWHIKNKLYICMIWIRMKGGLKSWVFIEKSQKFSKNLLAN